MNLMKWLPSARLGYAYWIVVISTALWVAQRIYHNASLPYRDCPDGHCPDPGTREYLAGIKSMNDGALGDTVTGFFFVILLGLAGYGVFVMCRWLTRLASPKQSDQEEGASER